LPADNYIKPQLADQVAWIFPNFKDNAYSLIEEAYYKIVNRLNYIDGADLIANEAIEQIILNGWCALYGLEFYTKRTGVNGWISYTVQNLNSKLLEELLQNLKINNSSGYNSVYMINY
jgi:hypothetical protein